MRANPHERYEQHDGRYGVHFMQSLANILATNNTDDRSVSDCGPVRGPHVPRRHADRRLPANSAEKALDHA